MSCWGRKPTIQLRPVPLHKSPQEEADREQINKFQAAFSDDLWVAEAGNRPYGYDPHSYTSQHRQQLIGSKLKNFGQLHSIDLWVAEAGNQPFSYDPLSYTSHHRQLLIGSKLTNLRQVDFKKWIFLVKNGLSVYCRWLWGDPWASPTIWSF